ncbi:MAG: hypothetical protein BGO51_15520 [Rhodospirillales bacterium 69-11]|nr:MAG: hypothetical protein BGO51_15520 [Rhodospirillales bacterium 69-11]
MYTVKRTRNGRVYEYQQETYRVGKKVKTRYKGKVSRHILAHVEVRALDRLPGSIDMEAIEKEELGRQRAVEERYKAGVEELHQQFGLTVGPSDPVPVEKPVGGAPSKDEAAPSAADSSPVEAQEDSSKGGGT